LEFLRKFAVKIFESLLVDILEHLLPKLDPVTQGQGRRLIDRLVDGELNRHYHP